MNGKNNKRCFVIMPFSTTTKQHTEEYWTKFFKEFIQPAFHKCGYHAFRSEDTPRNITKSIIQHLATNDLVLAVLTDNNPNVWYELGVRHSLRQGTIMMLEKDTKIPFDVHSYGIIRYSDKDRESFITDVKRYLSEVDKELEDSPVADFLNNKIPMAVNTAIGRLKGTVELINEKYREDNAHAVLEEIARKQTSWHGKGQVSIVEKDKIILHENTTLKGEQAKERWKDNTENSLFPAIWASRTGLMIAQLQSRPGRTTALAYETLIRPECLVIAEAHAYLGEKGRPY
jgi:hypothetical protein